MKKILRAFSIVTCVMVLTSSVVGLKIAYAKDAPVCISWVDRCLRTVNGTCVAWERYCGAWK